MKAFKKVFRGLPDPRADNARHDLLEVLIIALAATLCGADSCAEMAEFGQSKEGFLRVLLRPASPATIPSAGCSACSSRKPLRRCSGDSSRGLRQGQ